LFKKNFISLRNVFQSAAVSSSILISHGVCLYWPYDCKVECSEQRESRLTDFHQHNDSRNNFIDGEMVTLSTGYDKMFTLGLIKYNFE